jgi:hypothetical protein
MAAGCGGVAAPGKVRRIARFPDCGIQGGAVGLNIALVCPGTGSVAGASGGPGV